MRTVLATVLIAASLLAAATPAAAQRRDGGRGPRLDTPFVQNGREPREERRGMSPNEAAREAQRENGGGRVLSVEPSGSGYRVKLLRDGEVRIVHVR